MKRFWTWAGESYGVFLSLCVFYPVLFFLRNNSHMFQVCEIFEGLGWIFLGCLPLFLLDIGTRSWNPRGRPQRWLDAGVVGVGIAIVVMGVLHPMYGRFFRYKFYHYKLLRHFLWCLPAPLIALAALKWRKKVVVGCLVVLCSAAIVETSQREYRAAQIDKKLLPPAKALPITFKKKPNVYFIGLESYDANANLREIYHINSDKLMALLNKQGFTVIENCFANYDYTYGSLSSVFLMRHHYNREMLGEKDTSRTMRAVIAGENGVFSTFKANGYKLNIVHKGGSSGNVASCVDYVYVARDFFRSYRAIAYQLGLGEVINFIENVCGRSDARMFGSYKTALRNLLKRKEIVPQFFFIFTGASHSEGVMGTIYQENLDFFEKEYKKIRHEADVDLMELLALIQEHDPEALIILFGDHAAHRYDWAHHRSDWGHDDWARVGGVNPNAAIRSYGLEPSLVARDYVGVLCAIRWPLGVMHYSAGRVISHVNLFRHVFAALAEDPDILKQGYQPDESYVFFQENKQNDIKLLCIARNGHPLDEWEVFTPPPLE
jgi:hypothetical protein